MFEQSHAKTEAGRAEIRAHAVPLSRTARNLLHVLDASRPLGEWLRLVTGATEADLQMLIQHGLIAPQAGPAARAPVSAAAASVAPISAAAPAAAPQMDRAQLYTYLSGEATKLLGPFKGYAFALKVERCDSLIELQALALKLVEQVQASKGEDAAAAVREALGLR